MFTGLVAERGRLIDEPKDSSQGGKRIVVDHSVDLSSRLNLGASLAVSGTCLTIIGLSPGRSEVELSPETLVRTTLGDLSAGSEVNLEPPLRIGDPLGGHWVQGHVDTTTEVVRRDDLKEHRVLALRMPMELRSAVVEKGSVTVDGVSLTVSARSPDQFEVALIPHTLEVTTLGDLVVGDRVNLEVDILSKYVQQALADRES